MRVGTCPEFFEVLDRTALQGICMRATELGAELLLGEGPSKGAPPGHRGLANGTIRGTHPLRLRPTCNQDALEGI